MFKSVILAGIQKALYGCAASLVVGISQIAQAPPPSDEISAFVWQLAVIPAVTGVVGALKRAFGFKPELSGR